MYLVENAHEPIIDRETFDRVQEMKGHIKQAVQMEQMLWYNMNYVSDSYAWSFNMSLPLMLFWQMD